MLVYVAIFLASVFISSISQVLLKKSAGDNHDSRIKEYLNFRVIIAYSLFFTSSLMTVWAYKFVPLSMGPILEASGYVFVTGLSVFFLKEKVGVKKAIGLALIVSGIIVFGALG